MKFSGERETPGTASVNPWSTFCKSRNEPQAIVRVWRLTVFLFESRFHGHRPLGIEPQGDH